MDCYIIINANLYLDYWSDELGWTLYRSLATEYIEHPISLPMGENVILIRSEQEK